MAPEQVVVETVQAQVLVLALEPVQVLDPVAAQVEAHTPQMLQVLAQVPQVLQVLQVLALLPEPVMLGHVTPWLLKTVKRMSKARLGSCTNTGRQMCTIPSPMGLHISRWPSRWNCIPQWYRS